MRKNSWKKGKGGYEMTENISQKKTRLKKEYMETPRPAGIFQIRNTVNGKVFLVSSVNLNAAMNRHRFDLKMGSHMNRQMQADWNEYGADSFVFEILDFIEPDSDPNKNYSDDVKVLEEMWLEKIEPYGDRGYNVKTG